MNCLYVTIFTLREETCPTLVQVVQVASRVFVTRIVDGAVAVRAAAGLLLDRQVRPCAGCLQYAKCHTGHRDVPNCCRVSSSRGR